MIEKIQIGDLVTLSEEFLEKYKFWRNCGTFIFVVKCFSNGEIIVHVQHISGNKIPKSYSSNNLAFYHKSLTKL